VHAGVFQLAGPQDVARLVEARAQFDQHRHLLVEATEAPRRSWKKERLFIDLLSRLAIEAKAFRRGAFRSDN
jgi:hypothetical protein